jgi:hypothetical protein
MREIIALEIKTAFIHFYTKIITLFVIGGILFACFSPVDVFIMLIVCFLFFPFVCVVVYFCVKTTLPFFMNLRMRYKSTLIHHEYFIDTSLDEFDEQIIEGINRKKVLNISI